MYVSIDISRLKKINSWCGRTLRLEVRPQPAAAFTVAAVAATITAAPHSVNVQVHNRRGTFQKRHRRVKL